MNTVGQLRCCPPRKELRGYGANDGSNIPEACAPWIGFPSYVQWQSPQQSPGSSGQLNGTTYVAFDISNVPAGSSVQVPILLTAPDNPIYAHQRFQVQVWKEGK